MPYTIRSSDGQRVISEAVSRNQMHWLRGLDDSGHRRLNRFNEGVPSMIRVSKRSDQIWLALVDDAVIRAELRRGFKDASQVVAEANRTVGKTAYATPNGRSGWYFEHRLKRAFSYLTTQASADEMSMFVLRSVIAELVRGHGTTDDFHAWFGRYRQHTSAQARNVQAMIHHVAALLVTHDRGRLTDEQLVSSLRDLITPAVRRAA